MTIGEFFQEEYLKVSQALKTGKIGGEIKHFLSNPAATEAQLTAIGAKLLDEVAKAGNDAVTISAELVADVKAFGALVQAHPDAPGTTAVQPAPPAPDAPPAAPLGADPVTAPAEPAPVQHPNQASTKM